ncbi:hypothetical protein Asp14428_41710 [Actinoplanes sp. NBRC 14428]|nr:hypothetical protein Asp14428_41710 [Actinoplanes sp. NBRC 14428]
MEPEPQIKIQDIVQKALDYGQHLQAAQAELERALITGRSEDGTVTVVCNGIGKVSAVQVDPRIYDERDPQRLQRAIVEAIRAAGSSAGDLAGQRMGEVQVSLY